MCVVWCMLYDVECVAWCTMCEMLRAVANCTFPVVYVLHNLAQQCRLHAARRILYGAGCTPDFCIAIAPIHALATKWNVFSMGTRASFATTISTHSRNLSDATCNVRNARMQHAAHSVQRTTVQNAHAKANKSNSIQCLLHGPRRLHDGCAWGALFRRHARMFRGAHAGYKLHAAPAVAPAPCPQRRAEPPATH